MFSMGFVSSDSEDIKIISRIICKKTWSPCLFKDGKRTERNFVAANFAALDFDSPETPLADIHRRICDMTHILGTTKSHQKEKNGVICDRFRLLLKFEKPIENIFTYRKTMKKLIDHYGSDKACVDGARFFWPCKEILSIEECGYLQEVYDSSQDENKIIIEEKQRKIDNDKNNLISSYTLNIINNGLRFVPKKTGEKDNSKSCILFRAALELARKNWPQEKIETILFRKISFEELKEFDRKKIAKSAVKYA